MEQRLPFPFLLAWSDRDRLRGRTTAAHHLLQKLFKQHEVWSQNPWYKHVTLCDLGQAPREPISGSRSAYQTELGQLHTLAGEDEASRLQKTAHRRAQRRT